jgi:hypothetical protein
MSYERPTSSFVVNFTGGTYTPPGGSAVNFDFVVETPERIVLPHGIDSAGVGSPTMLVEQFATSVTVGDSVLLGLPQLTARWAADFNFEFGYTPPLGNAVYLVFGSTSNDVFPIGESFAEFGQPSVRNGSEYVSPSGFSHLAFGTPYVYLGTQFINAGGYDFSSFGITRVLIGTIVDFDFTDAYVPPPGDAVQLVFGAVYGTLYPTGVNAAAFGNASVQNSVQLVQAAGADSREFGTAAVTNAANVILPSGLSSFEHGRPTVELYIADISIPGADSAEIGTPEISHFIREVFPEGFDSSELGTQGIELFDREVLADGPWDSAEIGTHRVRRYGVHDVTLNNTSSFGSARISNLTQYCPIIDGDGHQADYSAFGVHLVENRHRQIFTSGIRPLPLITNGMGVPDVSNFNRYITGIGLGSARYGLTDVQNYIKYITPEGINSMVVFDENSQIEEDGQRGNVRVHGIVNAIGIDGAEFGEHALSITSNIRPTGWESYVCQLQYIQGEFNTHHTGHDSSAFGTHALT